MQQNSVFSEKTVISSDSFWRSISTRPSRQPKYTPEVLRRMHYLEQLLRVEVEGSLEAAGVELAILSRSGSGLGRYRFDTEVPDFTHSGFAVKLEGQWYVDHLMNWHEGDQGLLVRHPLIEFFRDDPRAYRISMLIPSEHLQIAIRKTLLSPVREAVHSLDYSRFSYPFSARYQNSNQWLAEIIGASQSGESEREDIQQFLRENGLSPSVLRLNAAEQLAVSAVAENARLDDHPWRSRLRGRIEFLVEPSLRHYLQISDPRCRVEHISVTKGFPVH